MAAFLQFRFDAFAILFIFTTTIPLLLAAKCQQSPSHFNVEPSDQTVTEGGRASFNCTSRNFNSATDTLSWNIFPNVYESREVHVFNSSSQEMTSSITVENLGKTVQYFTCNLNTEGNLRDRQDRCFASRKATLFVQYFPSRDELTCNPQHPVVIKNGQTLRIMCEVPRSEPAVDLSWRFNPPGAYDQHLPTHRDDGAYRVLSHQLFATQQLHLKEIICGVTSDLVFPGLRHQCSIGPIKVLYPPHVFVQPRQAKMISMRPTELSCMADGYPEHFYFSWSCFPEGILSGCDGKGQIVNLYLPKVHLSSIVDVDHISVICTAANSEGSGMGSSRITISREILDEMPLGIIKPDSSGCTDNVTINITTVSQKGWDNNSEITFACTASGQTRSCGTQNLKWYLGNGLFSGNTSYDIEGKIISYLSVGLASIDKINDIRAVGCGVNVLNTTIKSWYNLTQLIEQQLLVTSADTVNILTTSTPHYAANILQSVIPESLNDTMNDTHLHFTITHTNNLSGISGATKSGTLKMWQIVAIAVAGVLTTVILTACVVAIISMFMYKHFTGMHSTVPKTLHINESYQDRYSVGDDSIFNVDPIYEEPHVPSLQRLRRCKSLPDVAQGDPSSLKHIYDSNVYHSSYISTSSESSWSSSTDSQEKCKGADDTPSSGSSDQGMLCNATYGNDKVVNMEFERRHTLGHDMSHRKQRQKFPLSMPPLPPNP